MIIDHFDNAGKYFHLHPQFKKVFTFLQNADLENISPGEHPIENKNHAVVLEIDAAGKDAAAFESHRKYIDIHCTISGQDVIGWKNASKCTTANEYNAEHDYSLYSEKPEFYFPLPANHFAIFYPEDVHEALACDDHIKKIVLKVKIDE
jgi:biofilm protein TabA